MTYSVTTLSEAIQDRTPHTLALFGDYTESADDYCQFVFGDLSYGDAGACPLKKITKTRFFISWGAIEGVYAVYSSGEPVAGWTFGTDTQNVSEDLFWTYSYIEFESEDITSVSAKVRGIVSNDAMLERPDDILEFLVDWYGVSLFSVMLESNWYKFKNETTLRSLIVSGILSEPSTLFSWAVEILTYLFFVRLEDGRVAVFTEQSNLDRYPKASCSDSAEDDVTIESEVDLDNIKNSISMDFKYNWVDNAYMETSTTLTNQESVDNFGFLDQKLEWKWGRDAATALDVVELVLKRVSQPQLLFTVTMSTHRMNHLRYNDVVYISSEEAPYVGGKRLTNTFCTVRNAKISGSNYSMTFKALYEYWEYREFLRLATDLKTSYVNSDGDTINATYYQSDHYLGDGTLFLGGSTTEDYIRI